MRIAVVAETDDIRTLIRDLLEERGWDALFAPEVAATPKFVQGERPDLVIVDLPWYDSDYLGLIERLCLDPRTAGIPMLVCSAAPDRLTIAAPWFAHQNIAILDKPFDIDDLYRYVDDATGPSARSCLPA